MSSLTFSAASVLSSLTKTFHLFVSCLRMEENIVQLCGHHHEFLLIVFSPGTRVEWTSPPLTIHDP